MDSAPDVVLRLKITEPESEFSTDKTCVSIGRSPDCDLPFPGSSRISRRHAVILREERWYLTDLGSTNGTWLNGQRLTPHVKQPLNPGDVIDFAHTQTVVFLEGKPEEQPRTGGSAAAETSPRGDAGAVAYSPPAAPPRQYCPQCGSQTHGVFCTVCGFRVGTRDLSVPPQPSVNRPPEACCAQPAPRPAASVPPAAPKQGLLSKVGSLFGKKSAKTAEAPITPDDVQFRGAAPESITPGEYFPVKIMMYREDDYARADRESAALGSKVRSASSSVFQASRGQQFRITLQSPDIELDCETQTLAWNGTYAAADFELRLPEDCTLRQLRLRGRVYSGDAVLTDLKLILQISAPQPQSVPCEKVHLRSAFISYASADRSKVVARIQGIQLACPDMDLFFDVESLRRGEAWEPRLYQEIGTRDLFYLFWSRNAAASEWVRKELSYAVSHMSMDYIEPIPLESPDTCPPPESLNGKHFNDWTLRYLGSR